MPQVLQAMPNGGESWTAEDVDQLLAQADSSGDGQLQIQVGCRVTEI